MRIVRQLYTALAAGFSPWVMVNYLQPTFNVAMAVLPSADATGASFQVQYTMDDLSVLRPVQLSQATTVISVTDPLHGLSTGDSVTLQATGTGQSSGPVSIDGTYQIASIVDANNYTVTGGTSQTVSSRGALSTPQRVFPFTGIPAASAARIANNLLQPCTAVRLDVAALTGGHLDFLVIQGQD